MIWLTGDAAPVSIHSRVSRLRDAQNEPTDLEIGELVRTISHDELRKIPYLDLDNIQGRVLSSLTFYAEARWSVWMQTDVGLIEMQAWPAESFYFSDAPELDTDMCFHFLDFIVQRASYPEVAKYLWPLKDDIFNMSACLAKIKFLHEKRGELSHGLSRMIVGEIEYLISVCRSMFDLLQELISKLWGTIRLLDETIIKKPLRETFSKMVLSDNKPRSVESIHTGFNLPTPLAEFYGRQIEFFVGLRSFRDNIMHGGSSVDTVFVGENDFWIRERFAPLAVAAIWRESDRHPNDLVDLTPALNAIVCRTLYALNDFSSAIGSIIQFPPPIVPGMAYYMRGYHNAHLCGVIDDYNARENERTL